MTDVGRIARITIPVVGAMGLLAAGGTAVVNALASEQAPTTAPPPQPSPLPTPGPNPARGTYTNPVFSQNAPDPSVIRADDGVYYAYTTESAGLPFQVLSSKDLVKWERVGAAFEGTGPTWISKHRWAPDVKRTGDHYTMLYSGRGEDGRMRIGYATSPKPGGPFEDHGVLIEGESGGYNIDPFLKQVGKDWIIYYGSTGGTNPRDQTGISAVGVDIGTDGSMKLKGEPEVVMSEVGDRELVEGAWVHERDGMYYLFYSDGLWNSRGGPNDYAVKVARSDSPTGPFEKHGAPLISQGNGFSSVGHNSIITDKSGRDWMIYHAFGPDESAGRLLMLDPIEWKNGWPIVRGGLGPSSTPMDSPIANARRGIVELTE